MTSERPPVPSSRIVLHSTATACLAIALGFGAALGCASSHAAQSAPPATDQTSPAAAQERPTLSRDASLIVYPVALADRPFAQVGEVVGMFLERGGMQRLELARRTFQPVAGRDLAATASAFGAQVVGDAIASDYALYCEFLGTPGKAVEEVRTVLVARDGRVVWTDRQTATDADFRAVGPREPMQCCELVAKRLQPVFRLDDPMRPDAPDGTLAKRWKQETGLPGDEERAAMDLRAAALRRRLPHATIAVFAPHVPKVVQASADDLALRLREAGIEKATATPSTPDVTVRYGMNEQMVLWSFARSFSEALRKKPPESEYALLADYLFAKDAKGEVGVIGVHFTLCTNEGEIVLVDFQNSHQADFAAIRPATREDCDRLVAKRLATLLR